MTAPLALELAALQAVLLSCPGKVVRFVLHPGNV
jgi:hypothetical protein